MKGQIRRKRRGKMGRGVKQENEKGEKQNKWEEVRERGSPAKQKGKKGVAFRYNIVFFPSYYSCIICLCFFFVFILTFFCSFAVVVISIFLEEVTEFSCKRDEGMKRLVNSCFRKLKSKRTGANRQPRVVANIRNLDVRKQKRTSY